MLSFSPSPILFLLTLNQGHSQTSAAQDQGHHHQQAQVHHQSLLLIASRTPGLLTELGHWSYWGMRMETERPALVLQRVRKRHLSLSPKADRQRSMVMTVSPDGVSKRGSGEKNCEEAQKSTYCALGPPLLQIIAPLHLQMKPHLHSYLHFQIQHHHHNLTQLQPNLEHSRELTVCQATCHILVILLDPYDTDVIIIIPSLQISNLRAWRGHA